LVSASAANGATASKPLPDDRVESPEFLANQAKFADYSDYADCSSRAMSCALSIIYGIAVTPHGQLAIYSTQIDVGVTDPGSGVAIACACNWPGRI
jgi:hypothetical protein